MKPDAAVVFLGQIDMQCGELFQRPENGHAKARSQIGGFRHRKDIVENERAFRMVFFRRSKRDLLQQAMRYASPKRRFCDNADDAGIDPGNVG